MALPVYSLQHLHAVQPAPASPIVGSGVMANRIRAFDWAATPLGDIATWSYTLRTHINLVLCSPHPSTLCWGPELIFLYNDATIPLLGKKHRQALGRSYRDVLEEAWPRIGADFETCLKRGRAVARESTHLPSFSHSQHHQRYFSYFLIPVHDQGAIVGIHGCYQDVTDHAMNESRMASEIATLNALFDQAPATIALMLGPDHVYAMVNQNYQQVFGQLDYLGQRVIDALPEAEEQGFVAKLDKVYKTGIPFRANNARFLLHEHEGQPAKEIYLDYVYQPRLDAKGHVCGIISLGVDVTERVRAEHALIQNEKLAAVGRLASSIAHEINNPLTSVLNFLFLSNLTTDLEEIRGYHAVMEAELRRVSNIAHQTLASQRHNTTFTSPQFATLSAGVLSLYDGRIREANVHVETLHRDTAPLRCMEGEIRQVVGNLVANALDAMLPTGGRLLIRSHQGTDWSTGKTIHRLTVADTGSGMPQNLLDEIFKPFFTTKGEAGNGLGLWISQEIIARHQGSLRVRTSQQVDHHGTVYTISLPV